MSKQWLRCLMAGAMLALSVGSAQATTVFNNLAVGTPSLGPNFGTASETAANAFQFTTGSMSPTAFYWLLNSVTLKLQLSGGTASSPVVGIYTNDPAGDFPGSGPLTLLDTFTGSGPTTSTLGNYTFNTTVSGGLHLDPGSAYWVVLFSSPGDAVYGWSYKDDLTGTGDWFPAGGTGPLVYADGIAVSGGVLLPAGAGTVSEAFAQGNGIYQMSLEATSAVPEPSTYVLLMISLGVVGYARKRMNNKA